MVWDVSVNLVGFVISWSKCSLREKLLSNCLGEDRLLLLRSTLKSPGKINSLSFGSLAITFFSSVK